MNKETIETIKTAIITFLVILVLAAGTFGIWAIVQNNREYERETQRLLNDGCKITMEKKETTFIQQCSMVNKVMICHPTPVTNTKHFWTCPDGRGFWRD